MKEKELIKKLKEYIKILETHTRRYELNNPFLSKRREEIATLESEIKQDTFIDEHAGEPDFWYMTECDGEPECDRAG